MKKEKLECLVKREIPGLREILKVREYGFISEERAREYYGRELDFFCGQDKRSIYAEFVRRPEGLIFRPLTEAVLEMEPWEYHYSSRSFFRSKAQVAYVVCADKEVVLLKASYRQEWNDKEMEPQEERAPIIGQQLALLERKEIKFIVLVDSHESTEDDLIVRVAVYRARSFDFEAYFAKIGEVRS